MMLRSNFATIQRFGLAILLTVVAVNCTVAEGGATDRPPSAHDQWTSRADVVLKDVVGPTGLVNYDRSQAHRKELDDLVIRAGRPWNFENGDEKLALHINAYNLIVIRSVIDHWPVSSVREVEGFFDKLKHRVDGRQLTLNDLENKIIRSMGRPRIHAALVCAAMSCPPLRRGAYTPENLGDQLEQITRRWINDTRRNQVRDGTLRLSAIFKWYGDDFSTDPFGGVLDFVKRHANEGTPIAELLNVRRSPTIQFLEYDWKLNAVPED